ncbi:MAG: hypothetical protein MR030_01195 [Bacteroidales bacterium]|nr:hypothetical protein [Bacteroidales bacterium]
MGEDGIVSPHGALRAYTVLLTAEPRRGSPMAHLLQHRTLSDSSDWSDWSDSSPRLFDGVTSSVSSEKGCNGKKGKKAAKSERG